MGDVFKRYKFDRTLGNVVIPMLGKFMKYFYPVPNIFAFAVLLDTCCRIRGLRTFLEMLEDQVSMEYVKYLEDHKKALQETYRLYELRFGAGVDDGPVEQTSPSQRSWNLIRKWQEDHATPSASSSSPRGQDTNELNVYLDQKFNDTRHDNLVLLK